VTSTLLVVATTSVVVLVVVVALLLVAGPTSLGFANGPGGGNGISAANTAPEAKAVAIANATRFLLSIFTKELLKI
jgi:hypothetical protein